MTVTETRTDTVPADVRAIAASYDVSDAPGGTFTVLDPATGERVAELADGTVDDATAAVDAAADAFPSWSATRSPVAGSSTVNVPPGASLTSYDAASARTSAGTVSVRVSVTVMGSSCASGPRL